MPPTPVVPGAVCVLGRAFVTAALAETISPPVTTQRYALPASPDVSLYVYSLLAEGRENDGLPPTFARNSQTVVDPVIAVVGSA